VAKFHRLPRQQPQTFGVIFLGVFQDNLTADANSQNGRSFGKRLAQRRIQPALAQDAHRRARRAHAREDDSLSAENLLRRGRNLTGNFQMRQRPPYRSEISGFVIYQSNHKSSSGKNNEE